MSLTQVLRLQESQLELEHQVELLLFPKLVLVVEIELNPIEWPKIMFNVSINL